MQQTPSLAQILLGGWVLCQGESMAFSVVMELIMDLIQQLWLSQILSFCAIDLKVYWEVSALASGRERQGHC